MRPRGTLNDGESPDKSGSYQRPRDDLQMLLLTDEQVYSAAYALAGHEKWLKKKHGKELKPAA